MRDFLRAKTKISLLAPLLLLASPAFTQELVTNGGFETPNITPDTNRFPVAVNGWNVIGAAGAEVMRGFGGATAYDGAQWLELDVTSNTTIFQDLTTVPGQTYLLRYAVANRPSVPSSQVRVFWGGTVLDEHVVSAPGWVRVIKLVQATSASTRLQFEARGASDSQGDWLDAVSVTQLGSNVIQNGSFENPPIGVVSANIVVPNWTSSGPGGTMKIDRGLEGIQAADGAQWAELDGVGNTNIYQDVPAQTGQRYLLTFSIANRQGSSGSTVQVMWNGQSQGTFSTPLTTFQTHRVELTASGATQRLEFRGAGTADGAGDLLDNVLLQPILIASEFSGTFRIRVKATGRFLHEDGTDRLVSTRFQPDDDTTRFVPERQSDGSYRIRVKATGRAIHEDAIGDRLVSTRFQTDDDNTRFFLELQPDSSYRIRAKGSNRYLYEDNSDRLISTRQQPTDDSSRFFLDPVGNAPGTTLTSLPASMAFNYNLGASVPPSQTLTISTTPTGTAFTVDAPSVPWLTVAPAAGSGPTNLTVSVNPTGLSQGTLSTQITVRSADALPLAIPVTLTVTGGTTGAVLLASPSSLTFNFTLGGATPASQALTVSSTPTGAAFTVDPPSVSWLVVQPLSGTTLTAVTVAVNPAGLTAGQLTSQITIRAPGSNPISIPVTLNVTASGGGTGSILVASPASISANFQPGGAQPTPQSVTLSSTTGSASFSIDPVTVSWVSVTPTSGTAPTVLTLLFNTTGLGVGTFSTQIIVRPTGLGSTTPLAIPVTLTVGTGGGTGGAAQIIAQMADGAGWQTQIILVNRDSVPAGYTLRFWAPNGQPLNLAVEGESSAGATLTGTIPVGGSRTVTSAGTSAQLSVGWVEMISAQSVGGVSVFRSVASGQEAAVGLTTPVSRFLLPFDNTNNRVTSMAIVNTNASQAVVVNVVIRDEFGGSLGSGTVELGARGHAAFELFNRFAVTAGRRGVAEFSTNNPDITALGLRFTPQGAFTSFPVQTR